MTKINFVTDLIFDDNLALAAISDNPNVKWAKFVFTDDQPNANKQRIPMEEFENILRTGPLMPIKMASGEIKDGHEKAEPIGVISHLKQEENKILGLAAFWIAEREKDINLLKTMAANENKPQLSWEVWFEDSSEDAEGIEDLHGVTVRASTIVGKPAYQGRTPILAMSSEIASENTDDEEIKENSIMDFEKQIEELETRLANSQEELNTVKAELETAIATLTAKAEMETTLEAELNELRAFKQQMDEINAENERVANELARLEAVRAMFTQAGIEKDAEYFDQNKERFLGMDEPTLEFIIQEMVIAKAATASVTPTIPNINGEAPISDPITIGRLLRQSQK